MANSVLQEFGVVPREVSHRMRSLLRQAYQPGPSAESLPAGKLGRGSMPVNHTGCGKVQQHPWVVASNVSQKETAAVT
jgi:hypothetical protein